MSAAAKDCGPRHGGPLLTLGECPVCTRIAGCHVGPDMVIRCRHAAGPVAGFDFLGGQRGKKGVYLHRQVIARGEPPSPPPGPEPSANGTGHPKEPLAGSAPGQPQTSAEIIREYLTARYRPVYREGVAIRCRDGSTVAMGTACAVPTTALIDRLAAASDAPRYQDGRTKRDALPAQYRRWSPVAWGDLLDGLPDEDAAEMGDLGEPAEEFRRLVRSAMLSTVVLGETIGRDGDPTRTERRSLIDWCFRFAKSGPWRSIRSYRCWCRTADRAGGEIELRVAVRHELFAQIHADRRLVEMGATKFARRAKRYGVGASSRDDRPHGVAAIVLDRGLVADLTAGLADADTDPEPDALER